VSLELDPAGFVAGIGVGLGVLVTVLVMTAGITIFRRVAGA
jgi:hypothetical protein